MTDPKDAYQALLDSGYQFDTMEVWPIPVEVEPMDKERDGTLENWRRSKPGSSVQLTIRMSKPYEASHETEWPTEVSDELIAFARAAAEIARKHGPTFKTKEKR